MCVYFGKKNLDMNWPGKMVRQLSALPVLLKDLSLIPAPILWLRTVYKSNSRRSDTFFFAFEDTIHT